MIWVYPLVEVCTVTILIREINFIIAEKNFNPYTGPGFNNLEILKEINKFNLNYKKVKPKSLVASAAKDILSGNIIGWFQGRAEMGPRALGARSVLADPRKLESKIIVNSYLKKEIGLCLMHHRSLRRCKEDN